MYDREELIADLEEAYSQMQELVNQIEHLIHYVPKHMQGRAKSMMLSHLQMALNDEHMWVGGNMYTLAELIEELKDDGNFEDEEELEEVAPIIAAGARAAAVGAGRALGAAAGQAAGNKIFGNPDDTADDNEASAEAAHSKYANSGEDDDEVEESGRFSGPTTYLIAGPNLLANIGCEDTANGFVAFLQSKGIEANLHPVGLGVAKDALAIRTEEMSAKLQELMAEFAQSEFNPRK